ncbi:mitochondrial inner membrane protease subunit 1 isoform X2 [Crotalus tigris]|uniref:mitochondrial inner membrane protease subunit 1 isoform X2 n=1 Tax=Crotalus tigris TaxID=88082 RepID=UPI00192F6779|nr:mitochondrial inner membrane protease subunit 1 isoform X2 [Crotalus tigris]
MLKDVIGKTFRLLGYTIQYGCIAHCVFEYLGGIVMCTGPSMEPTIQNSDIVFSENLSSHLYRIQKGDIVIAKNPADPKTNICKRVMGLEGEKVCTSNPADFIKTHSYFQLFNITSDEVSSQVLRCFLFFYMQFFYKYDCLVFNI